VPRVARHAEIRRAHDRLVEEFAKDTTPPDPRREARIRGAFAALSDEARRAEYDRSLDACASSARRPKPVALAAVAALLAAGGVLAWLLSGRGDTAGSGRPAPEIQAEVAASIGRVQSLDLAGQATVTGIAFTVAKGVMATTCAGIGPNAQLVVMIGNRAVPARVALADEALGLCRLAVHGAGSWPIPLNAAPPAVGARVYAAGLDAAGEVTLAEGKVQRTVAGAPATAVDASVPAGGAIGGRPLLDAHGRVVAVATGAAPGGGVRHLVLPPAWADEAAPASASPAPAPPEAAPAVPGSAPAAGEAPATPPLPKPAQDRAEGIAKPLRPPPTVPGSL
jgi:hypothetical protein